MKSYLIKHKLIVISGLAALFIVLGAALILSNRKPHLTKLKSSATSIATITINAQGFTPATLKVKPGTLVIWTNQDTQPHRVASNPYPSHTDLPGLNSEPVEPRNSYSFTFTSPGRFGYHDELHPTTNGLIEVVQ